MRLEKRFGLLLAAVTVRHGASEVELRNVVVDTGSAATVLSLDALAPLGILPSPQDVIHHVFGVGGSEVVFARNLDEVRVGEVSLVGFEVEVSGMDYGLPVDGLLGLDFLEATGATLDLAERLLNFQSN